MSDDLDSLSDQELSERFATEVAGLIAPSKEETDPNERIFYWRVKDGPLLMLPSFATDAVAVLPWLEKMECIEIERYTYAERKARFWSVSCSMLHDDNRHATSPTFARAACIALLRSKR